MVIIENKGEVMSDCPKLEMCPFFNGEMPQKASTEASMKEVYCKAEYAKCARYRIAMRFGANHVPIDLYPFESKRIEVIAEKLSRK